MVVNCVIQFDNNPQGIYYSGQTLYGTVTLQVDKPKKVNEIVLKLKGFAHVHWTERKTSTRRDNHGKTKTTHYTVSYDGHEDYIKSRTSLQSQTTIEPGTYTYRFNCLVPETCPSSFEGTVGHIRYLVKVVLDRPWKFNQSFSKPFTVLKILDLNHYDSSLTIPSSFIVKKVFGIWPFNSEPLIAKIMVPQSCYVSGQSIPVSIFIDNKSGVSIYEVAVRLVMSVAYQSQSPRKTKHSKNVVQKVKVPGVEKRTEKTLHVNLTVPATPSTCLTTCAIIHISYDLEVELKSNGFHSNSEGKTSITIGNIPFVRREGGAAYMPQPLPRDNPSPRDMRLPMNLPDPSCPPLYVSAVSPDDEPPSYSGAMANSTPFGNLPDLPPPTYEEAVHLPAGQQEGDEDGGQDYGDKVFRPIYPTFDIPSPSAPTVDEMDATFAQLSMAKK